MASVAIVSDTTHYLPRDLAQEAGIHQVSLYVGWQGERQRELELDGFDSFYERLVADPQLPGTSQPSIGDFLAVWEPLLDAGYDVASVHISSGISGTVETARQAQEILRERGAAEGLRVIDSETTGGALGLLLLAASAAAREGADLDGIAERVLAARQALRFWFYVDTLEYLQRGGRIGRARAWLGSTLKIKPILSLGYEIQPVEKVRTTGRAFERMLAYARELADAGCDGWTVQHIQAPEQAQRLVERCREIFGTEPLFVSELGPVIGTYAGPGLFGVGALPRSLLFGSGS